VENWVVDELLFNLSLFKKQDLKIVSIMSTGQIPLWLPQSKHFRFENFVIETDSSNSHMLDSLRNYVLKAETPPFYFYGKSGAGKTHLQLAASNLSKDLGVRNTVYFDCSATGVEPDMLLSAIDAQCLCVDNVHEWSGNVDAEQCLFAIVEKAKNSNKCLILSSTSAPSETDFLLADLVSRLSSGLVFKLETLDDKGKMIALRQGIEARNLSVDDKVLKHLVTHFSRDNHSLFRAIEKLDKASMVEQRKLTIPFVQSVLLA